MNMHRLRTLVLGFALTGSSVVITSATTVNHYEKKTSLDVDNTKVVNENITEKATLWNEDAEYINSGISENFKNYSSPLISSLVVEDENWVDGIVNQEAQIIQHNNKAYTLVKSTGALLVSDSLLNISWRYLTDPMHSPDALYGNDEWTTLIKTPNDNYAYTVSYNDGALLKVDLNTGIWTKVSNNKVSDVILNDKFSSATYDSSNGEIVVISENHGHVLSMNATTGGAWTKINTNDVTLIEASKWNNISFDPDTELYFSFSNSGSFFELKNGSWSRKVVNSTSKKYMSGMFDETIQKLVSVSTDGTSKITVDSRTYASTETITTWQGYPPVEGEITTISQINDSLSSIVGKHGVFVNNLNTNPQIASTDRLGINQIKGANGYFSNVVSFKDEYKYYSMDKLDGKLYEFGIDNKWKAISSTIGAAETFATIHAAYDKIFALTTSGNVYAYDFVTKAWSKTTNLNVGHTETLESYGTNKLYTLNQVGGYLMSMDITAQTPTWTRIGTDTVLGYMGGSSSSEFYNIRIHNGYAYTVRRDTGKVLRINITTGAVTDISSTWQQPSILLGLSDGKFNSFDIDSNNSIYLISSENGAILKKELSNTSWSKVSLDNYNIKNIFTSPNTSIEIHIKNDRIMTIDPTNGMLYENQTLVNKWNTILPAPKIFASSFGQNGRRWTSIASTDGVAYVLDQVNGYLLALNKDNNEWTKVSNNTFKNQLNGSSDYFSSFTILNRKGYALTNEQGKIIEFDINTGDYIRTLNGSGDNLANPNEQWPKITNDGTNLYILSNNLGTIAKHNLNDMTYIKNMSSENLKVGSYKELVVNSSGNIYVSQSGNINKIWWTTTDATMVVREIALPRTGFNDNSVIARVGTQIALLDNKNKKFYIRQAINGYWLDMNADDLFTNEKAQNYYSALSFSGSNIFALEDRLGAVFSQPITFTGNPGLPTLPEPGTPGSGGGSGSGSGGGGDAPIDGGGSGGGGSGGGGTGGGGSGSGGGGDGSDGGSDISGPSDPSNPSTPGNPGNPNPGNPGNPSDPSYPSTPGTNPGTPDIGGSPDSPINPPDVNPPDGGTPETPDESDKIRDGFLSESDLFKSIFPFIAIMLSALGAIAIFSVVRKVYTGKTPVKKRYLTNEHLEAKYGQPFVSEELIDQTFKETQPKIPDNIPGSNGNDN